MIRDTYVEINLDNLKYNLENILERVEDTVKVVAVVKADGYGHGAVGISKVLMENGAYALGVATLSEALELRAAYPEYKIFVMGYTPDNQLHAVVSNDLIQCVFSLKQAKILSALGKTQKKFPKVHIKYDTGFNRLGFKDCPESIEAIKEIMKLDHLCVEGIFSHFALAGDEANKKQFKDFMYAVSQVESAGKTFKFKHICDSISAIDYPEFNLDMIRPGAILYGMKSFRKNDIDLKPVMSFKTKVYHVKKLMPGEGVSYNFKWKAERESVVATLPVGYSDGLPRNMMEAGQVTIHGKRAPIIGVICMDQCMVDVTDIPNVQVGDTVILYGDGQQNTLTIEEAAKLGKTNKNEILTRITRRTPRVYIKNGEIDHIVNHLLTGASYAYQKQSK